ncbi:MAG: NAD-dependent epimerase/dehydratase family protein [Candidatus Uhrbacteria bacterium]|nr:NAD-dependent epimerase/dehydratase family protein [Candidatus Uhrbacteria bacterium]
MFSKKAIVTGGSGFIGSHLVEALVSEGMDVVIIDKARPDKHRKIKHRKVDYKIIDVRDKNLTDVFKKIKPEVVFHLAAHINDRESVTNPVMNADNNITGSINVFRAASESGAKKVVFASSCAVYGEQAELPVTESMVPDPMTPYGYSKFAGEWYLDFFKRYHDLNSVVLRFGNVYGPRQDSSAESGVISIFTNKILKGAQATINNDGKTTRDYVYVGDVAHALVLAGTTGVNGLFNVGTGIETTTIDIFKMISAAVGAQISPDYREEQKDLLKCISCSPSLAKKHLKWAPQVTLEVGIAKTVDWYRNRI